MKELLKSFQDSAIEIREEKEVRKEVRLLGRQRKIPGLTLWEMDEANKRIRPAEFKKEDVAISSLSMSPESITKSNKVVVRENCIYIQALNLKNAERKFKILQRGVGV